MAFEDLREKLAEQWQLTATRFLESPMGAQLAERYENLPPAGQKGVIAAAAALVALALFMLPWSYYSASGEKVEAFEDSRQALQELFQVHRDSGELSASALSIDQDTLISTIQGQLPTLRLGPEQVKSVQPYDNKAAGKQVPGIPANVNQQGAEVQLAKLNLTQIVDVAHMLVAATPAAKLVGLDVQAAADDPRYFDAIYRVVAFSVPEPPAKPEPAGRSQRGDSGNAPEKGSGGDD